MIQTLMFMIQMVPTLKAGACIAALKVNCNKKLPSLQTLYLSRGKWDSRCLKPQTKIKVFSLKCSSQMSKQSFQCISTMAGVDGK